jgi:hypothetical protein
LRGYSIGHWVDEAGEGRFNLPEIETRYMKGLRTFEASRLPLHVQAFGSSSRIQLLECRALLLLAVRFGADRVRVLRFGPERASGSPPSRLLC